MLPKVQIMDGYGWYVYIYNIYVFLHNTPVATFVSVFCREKFVPKTLTERKQLQAAKKNTGMIGRYFFI
jgi:hypothetical protein